MFCNKCGNQINEGEKFCTQCGEMVPVEKVCPVCNNKLADGVVFCGNCGTKVGNETFNPNNRSSREGNNNHRYGNNNYRQGNNNYRSGNQSYKMVSFYVGEPTVGIAKATGTLTVNPDHLEFKKQLGNALGNAFGLVGMAVAANKAKQNGGNIEIYPYQDIQDAYVGRYAGVMPSVVIMMNDGQVFSFAGTFSKDSADYIVNAIHNNK